jgi:hypothetical protein
MEFTLNLVHQEEERRIALVMARKEEEKKRQDNRIAIMKVGIFHGGPEGSLE